MTKREFYDLETFDRFLRFWGLERWTSKAGWVNRKKAGITVKRDPTRGTFDIVGDFLICWTPSQVTVRAQFKADIVPSLLTK